MMLKNSAYSLCSGAENTLTYEASNSLDRATPLKAVKIPTQEFSKSVECFPETVSSVDEVYYTHTIIKLDKVAIRRSTLSGNALLSFHQFRRMCESRLSCVASLGVVHVVL